MTLLIMATCTVVWKPLHNFKMKRAQEARHNQFFFQNVQNNEIFEIFRLFKHNSCINVYYKKGNACIHWTACSIFNWKYIFLVNLVQKLKIISLSWNFVPWLIQYGESHRDVHFFCFRLEIAFWVDVVQQIKNVQLKADRKTLFGQISSEKS